MFAVWTPPFCSLRVHAAYLWMKRDFLNVMQKRAINKRDETRSDLCWCVVFPTDCCSTEFKTASRSAAPSCSSSLPAAAASLRQMSWHHAALCCELHLPDSTCGMTDVLFYRLLRLFLAHTPTNVTVKSLPFTPFPFDLLFLPSFGCCFHAQRGSSNTCVHVPSTLQLKQHSAESPKPTVYMSSCLCYPVQ